MPDKEYILNKFQEILESIEVIRERTSDIIKPDDFLLTSYGSLVFDACIMRLQSIGESVKRINDKTSERLFPCYPLVPWKAVIGLRNLISHEYSNVYEVLIFETIKNDIPAMKKTLLEIIKDLSS